MIESSVSLELGSRELNVNRSDHAEGSSYFAITKVRI